MPQATLVQSSFLGGEWSPVAQGRVDIPQYRTAMNVCFNAFPTVTGAWTTRSGTQGTDPTRLGVVGRLVKFDFFQAVPYNLEFTDGYIRFRSPYALVDTNDSVSVSSISSATPAVVTTSASTTWATGATVYFSGLGANAAAIQSRRFLITSLSGTTFSLADEITGASFNGTGLGFVSGTVHRVQEVTTPYISGAWQNVRVVQAEQTAVLVGGGQPPQYLTVTTPPTVGGLNAQFALSQPTFLDGPYLDYFTNGVELNPGATSGVTTMTLQFQAYSASQAYKQGDFVLSSSINYVSLQDDNVGHTPASSASYWAATTPGAAINGGQGWLGTDVGRLIRFFSEPLPWAVGTTYAAGAVVGYNPAGIPGQTEYWTSQKASNTGNIPGASNAGSTVNWAIATNAALWSWGKILSLTTQISQSVSGALNIGNMTSGGGLAAAFNGTNTQKAASSAARNSTNGYVGRNFSSGSEVIGSVTVYPTSDYGFGVLASEGTNLGVTINLYASNSSPSNATSGTLIGTTGFLSPPPTNAVSIVSTDQVNAYQYVWINVITSTNNIANLAAVSQLYYFNPGGTGTGAAVNVEILGAPLLYSSAIFTWQLGVYSNTTGWPTCGTYHEGRLWLGGAVSNRFDACAVLDSNIFNFQPTAQDGTVTPANGISYTLLGPSANPLLWMVPDQQGILCGTQAGEWLVQASALNSPLSPLNIQAHQTTSIGSYNVEPKRTDHTLVFVQRHQRRLMEYFADVFSGKFSAPDLSEFAKHVVKPNINEIQYQQDITPTIWCRTGDGNFSGVTYKRDSLSSSQGPTYAGWHRHMLGSGRTLVSISVGPSAGGNLDALSMVTFDSTTGLYYAEQLQDQFVENTDVQANGWFLDSATAAASYTVSGTTFSATGFYYLAQKTLRATAGGLDLGNVTVSASGTISLSLGSDPAGLFTAAFVSSFAGSMIVLVGSLYICSGQIVRPATAAESGARQGPAVGKKRRGANYAMQLYESQGLYVGTTSTRLNVINLTTGPDYGAIIPATTLKSGFQVTSLTDDYGFDSMVYWQVPGPYPATVVCLAEYLATQDK